MSQTTTPTNWVSPDELTAKTVMEETDFMMIHGDDGSKKMTAPYIGRGLYNLVCGKDAASHNNIWGGRDLTDVYTEDDLAQMCADEDFSDIGIGDYRVVEFTNPSGTTEYAEMMIGAINPFLHCGDTELTAPHLLRVPKDAFATLYPMNASNTTEGGYVASVMHATTLPLYYTALNTAMGGHILTHRRLLTNAISSSATSAAGSGFTGSSSNWAWSDVNLCLMSEPMVYGATAFSSSGRDVADANFQLPLFRMAPHLRRCYQGRNSGTRCNCWLCAVASSAHFAHCVYSGDSNYGSAGYSFGVRPYFLTA